jgi:hypothetical protein
METRNSLLRGDYWFQTIVGVIMIACCVSIVGIYFAALFAIPFGAWQIISGLCFGIAYNDKKRIRYVRYVTAYFAVMFGFYMLKDSDYTYFESNAVFDYLFSVIGVVSPIVLGIHYYVITYKAYHNIQPETANSYTNENILDA